MNRPEATEEIEETELVLHLKLSPNEVGELDTIVSWMKADPVIGRLKAKPSRAMAIRYAVGRLLRHPPEHVQVQG